MRELMIEAKRLGARKDTEWAEDHASEYMAFDRAINEAYDAGRITAREFDDLALTAFFDYFDLKCDED